MPVRPSRHCEAGVSQLSRLRPGEYANPPPGGGILDQPLEAPRPRLLFLGAHHVPDRRPAVPGRLRLEVPPGGGVRPEPRLRLRAQSSRRALLERVEARLL